MNLKPEDHKKNETREEIDEAKEAEWRREAEEILGHIGLTMDDAVRILIHQIVLRRGIPFEVKK